MKQNAKQMALGGVLAALAVTIMSLGGMIPVATYVCPSLCMMLQFTVLIEELDYAFKSYESTVFVGQHIVVLFSIDIKIIFHQFQQNPVLKVEHIETPVVDGDLGSTSRIQ